MANFIAALGQNETDPEQKQVERILASNGVTLYKLAGL
jgi:hypothetical protein